MSKTTLKTFLGLLLCVSFSANAQENLPEKIQNYFSNYQEEFPVEKAYLHLDKHTFTLGEDLWFSAYLVAGGEQIPSPLSKTLYVDFFDGDGLLLSQRVVKIENGRGAGDFQVPQFGKPGEYQIRAYTSWMRNFGEEYFFSQTVRVVDGAGGSFLPQVKFSSIQSDNGKTRYQVELVAINSAGQALSNQSVKVAAIAGKEELYQQDLRLNAQGEASFSFSILEKAYPEQHLELTFLENPDYAVTQKIALPYSLKLADIQFLPEGGNLVQGKKSVVAIRAIFPDGSPAAIQGNIANLENSSFETNERGLGRLEFQPEKATYQAQISLKSTGEKIQVNFPEAYPKGLVIQVQNNPEATYLSALIQGVGVEENLYLVSHTRGLVNFLMQGKLSNGVWGARIPKQTLPSGINTITVLTEDGKPLVERLVLVQNEDRLELGVEKNGSLNPRGKIKLTLSNSFQNQSAAGSFSVAVADADQVTEESMEKGSIFSHLLLSSDLVGKISQPGYYFQNQNPETFQELDLLMLTHGWRRFSWEDVLAEKYPENGFYIEQGITIEGQITEQTKSKKGLAGGKISALVGDGIELIGSEYGPDGRFILPGLDYSDSLTVTITAEDSRLKNFIDLEVFQRTPPFQFLPGIYAQEIKWPKELAASYQARNLMRQLNSDDKITDLEGITVEAKTLQDEQNNSRKLYGEGDASINPDAIPGSVGFSNIFQMIQGRVAGVRVSLNGFSVSVQIRGAGSIQAGTEPLYLLDNVPVDASLLFQVNPRDVQSIEVFKDPARTAIFGSQGANGVIAVYTKTGAGISYQSVGGNLVLSYGGYDSPREFYSPKYDVPAPSVSDQRATLFWKPLLEIGTEGKGTLEFFNSDSAKRLLIVVEGMDAKGRLGRLVKILD
ncbi:TonB-dependent receptor plug domain-containing protein [Algoriphagus mannitolivorans]|uniref:TonB-dependent receptor plug domain-containing protein n=1 Tax=Algoriphagus mannitolivorans TaxID=226504 RepID=UPI000403F348|nr:TonB-dependent receptor plug domain-containing protein [Algoriphagus mannitolivorans]